MSTLISSIQTNRWLRAVFTVLVLLAFSFQLGKMAANPGNVRLLLAASLMAILLALSYHRPRIVIFTLMVYLPFMSLFRRMLIPVAGWSSMDPLLLVGPVLAVLFVTVWLYKKYVLKEEIWQDTRLFKLIRWMIVVDMLQIFNPLQGSLLAGIAGVIYWTVPLFFMILGREYLNERGMKLLCNLVLIVGIVVAMYGFKQYLIGFASFEQQWIDLTGYTALQVYSVTRPISTFSSAAEYAHYLGIATVVGWVYVLRGSPLVKILALAAVVILYVNLFIESGRGVIVTVTAALLITTIMNSRGIRGKLIVGLLSLAVLSVLFVGMQKINSDNDLILHSVNGLSDPFGENSTALGHVELMFEGFQKGFANPLGYGLGSTTIAGGKFTGAALSSEVDLTNRFLATGVVGGLLYLFSMIIIFFSSLRMARLGGSTHLILFGILIAEAGQWLTGGHYAIAPLLWLMIGYLDKTSAPNETI